MKRLLLGLLFSGIFSCAVAQSEVCLPQLKALPDTDQLLKRENGPLSSTTSVFRYTVD